MTRAQTSVAFEFGTKGETLDRLAPLVGAQYFVAQLLFCVDDWRRDPMGLVGDIQRRFGGESALAVRSSAQGEDGHAFSMAGAYTSVVGVPPRVLEIRSAVEQVIASYPSEAGQHHVLVQPMIQDVVAAGVVLTRDLDTGSPYYVVNYDDVSGRTDSVTGGRGENKCILIRRNRPESLRSPRFRTLLALVQKLEQTVGSDELDIEFCITRDDAIHILQVRPLAARRNWLHVGDASIDQALEGVSADIERLSRPIPGLAGDRTLLGEMPDWNPAEMIGNCPRPLALSLYCRLITDSSWALARRNMGYRHASQGPLLQSLGGRPFIDVRLSLNSFLPAEVNPEFADRLIRWQIERLAAEPDLHDKIEFAIAATCRDLGFGAYRDALLDAGFGAAEVDVFGDQLRNLTQACVRQADGGLAALYERARMLADGRRAQGVVQSKPEALRLLARCIPEGIIPFAELARHAFIAVAFLRSAVDRGILDATDAEGVLKGVHTVAGDLAQDMYLLGQGGLSEALFLQRYGHLRPGTYDITSWRYDENPKLYLSGRSDAPAERGSRGLTAEREKALDRALAAEGYAFGWHQLSTYIEQAVRLREAAKFEFTRNVSDALSVLSAWGESLGLSRTELSYLRLDQIEESDDRGLLRESIAQAQARYDVTRALRLPHLIAGPLDVDVVRMPLGRPTFITGRCVTAPVRWIHVNEAPELNGEIVLIESADPGFDWIFSRRIGGLITKYGGANSHMAIRCAEFDLPAAIGCGERMFDLIARGRAVELNCASRTIKQAN